MKVPKGWHPSAEKLWHGGQRHEAIQCVLAELNHSPENRPAAKILQLAVYVFLIGDYLPAAAFLEMGLQQHPDHPEMLLNLGVCLRRGGEAKRAAAYLERFLEVAPGHSDVAVAYDGLCASYQGMRALDQAAAAGCKALEIKDRKVRGDLGRWRLPAGVPGDLRAMNNKPNVIAFSLFGADPRYLCGALDNMLAAKEHFPDWRMRFYVDNSVPAELVAALRDLGAETIEEPAGQQNRARLSWRFKVANDTEVGRFLVRDVDSVLSMRERRAVDAWIASNRWFHVMRDWWTHTDLILAGMWGGVAGVLPNISTLLANYRPVHVETPNIDQWFLRDEIWKFVRKSCLVHDRCFRLPNSEPWPDPDPPGTKHVGENTFAVDRAAQERRLGGWVGNLSCLRLAAAR